jgi:hypothetical protein
MCIYIIYMCIYIIYMCIYIIYNILYICVYILYIYNIFDFFFYDSNLTGVMSHGQRTKFKKPVFSFSKWKNRGLWSLIHFPKDPYLISACIDYLFPQNKSLDLKVTIIYNLKIFLRIRNVIQGFSEVAVNMLIKAPAFWRFDRVGVSASKIIKWMLVNDF